MNINIPPVTQALILANVIIYLLQMMTGSALVYWFALWPLGVPGEPGFGVWQLVTYGFLHDPRSLLHLFVNMFALFVFGGQLEQLFGQRWYAAYYLVCIVSAAIAQLVVAQLTGSFYYTVGASGGVFGLLLAFGMYFPHRRIMLLIPPIPMPAWAFVTLFGVLELYFGISGARPGVAHFAHLGGMVGGFLMIMHRRGNWPGGRR